jgi:hypothetical protein
MEHAPVTTHAAPAPVPAHIEPEVTVPRIPLPRLTPTRTELTVGEGSDRVTLTVTTAHTQVHLRATAAPDLARAMHASATDLRDALRKHGLDLGSMSASSEHDTGPDRDPRPHRNPYEPPPQPRDDSDPDEEQA